MTIDTIDDLLRLVRENEEYRVAMQRELLTEALLALPERFAAYTEVTDRRLSAIETDVSSLHGIMSRQQTDFANFRGTYAENEARRNDRLIAAAIARARGNRVRLTERLGYDELGRIFGEAVNRGLLSGILEDSEDSFQNSDLALRVHERNREQSVFYILAQASYTGQLNDYSRCRDHATIMRRVSGLDAYGVAVGVRIGRNMPDDLLFDANALVNSGEGVLWYQLREPRPEDDE